ncbi:hypothetical protein GQ55_6G242400 [Panicum hallii var. hallii]|uniref:Uncharacterized protein n=1 Tax=Panicum hallii var. hallii TaxID=1504633 RepID=A0A2T7D980_9POAL|nr:hypothetical protein GQ55_6G242400 [Panicum hallii var. hallii]
MEEIRRRRSHDEARDRRRPAPLSGPWRFCRKNFKGQYSFDE